MPILDTHTDPYIHNPRFKSVEPRKGNTLQTSVNGGRNRKSNHRRNISTDQIYFKKYFLDKLITPATVKKQKSPVNFHLLAMRSNKNLNEIRRLGKPSTPISQLNLFKMSSITPLKLSKKAIFSRKRLHKLSNKSFS